MVHRYYKHWGFAKKSRMFITITSVISRNCVGGGLWMVLGGRQVKIFELKKSKFHFSVPYLPCWFLSSKACNDIGRKEIFDFFWLFFFCLGVNDNFREKKCFVYDTKVWFLPKNQLFFYCQYYLIPSYYLYQIHSRFQNWKTIQYKLCAPAYVW